MLVVGSLAALPLAAHLHSRWLGGRSPFAAVYGALLAAVTAFGAWVVGTERILSGSPARIALSVLVGVAAGAAAWWSDRAILRTLRRRTRPPTPPARRSPSAPTPRNLRVAAATSGAKRRRLGAQRVQERGRPAIRIDGIAQLAAVGALEELDYRGVLVGACFLVSSPALRATALGATVAAFALSHIWFGWSHVAAKIPLGALAMAAALVAGCVVPALVAHVIFNTATARAVRKGAVPASSNRPAWLGPTPAL